MCRRILVRPIFVPPRWSKLRKIVVGTSRRCLQNVIASAAARESLAGDSLDSHRNRVTEALARLHFRKFFSQGIPSPSSGSVQPLRRRARALRQFESMSPCN
jgi:hypothetical protein